MQNENHRINNNTVRKVLKVLHRKAQWKMVRFICTSNYNQIAKAYLLVRLAGGDNKLQMSPLATVRQMVEAANDALDVDQAYECDDTALYLAAASKLFPTQELVKDWYNTPEAAEQLTMFIQQCLEA